MSGETTPGSHGGAFRGEAHDPSDVPSVPGAIPVGKQCSGGSSSGSGHSPVASRRQSPCRELMGLPSLALLAQRRRQPEWMDQPGLDAGEHTRALRGLGRLNRVCRSDAMLWPAIADVARAAGGEPTRVLDLAAGGGDLAIALARRAGRAGLDVRIEGCDISPVAVRFAGQKAADAGVSVRFFTLDVLKDPVPVGFDVVMCSLFLHHLDETDAVVLLRRM